jgi:mono/diheme cytochrome c family protein
MSLLRAAMLVLLFGAAIPAVAGSAAQPAQPLARHASTSPEEPNQQWMIEGEKRYRTNCGRCHQPPHRFSPQAMAMAVRQMRVRAMLTQEDMKYVLYYVSH